MGKALDVLMTQEAKCYLDYYRYCGSDQSF